MYDHENWYTEAFSIYDIYQAYDFQMHKILLNERVCGCKGQEDTDDDDNNNNITISSVNYTV